MSTMTTAPAARPVPAKFRRAVKVSEELSLRAGELVNSITDGHEVTTEDILALNAEIVKVNNKRRSTVDASTGLYFFKAAGAFLKARDAVMDGDLETASAYLDEGAVEMELVPEHVDYLFTR